MQEEYYFSVRQKALAINLEPTIYGTFAEIGAGQEVARLFFRAGGASGTIAKTISAYDMVFSDSIYGKEDSGRYVCESRLSKMLDKEYRLLMERLKQHRSQETKYFAFANTIAALNFNKTNEGHGWIGVRFQHESNAEESEVVLHVKLLDEENIDQQQAVGIIGVNLIHACFFHANKQQEFIEKLVESVGSHRMEMDLIKVRGPAFETFDNRVLGLILLKLKMTRSVLFNNKGEIQGVGESLYKKNILLLRGSFRPLTHINVDMFKSTLELFKQCDGPDCSYPLAVITMIDLRADGEIDEQDFLSRVDLITKMNIPVLISNYHEYYQLASYLGKISKKKTGLILGVYNLEEIFNKERFAHLEGGILQALGLLDQYTESIYAYPEKREDVYVDSKGINVDVSVKDFFNYFIQNKSIIDLKNYDKNVVSIHSREVMKMIKNGDEGIREMVPSGVADLIIEKGFFGFKKGKKKKK